MNYSTNIPKELLVIKIPVQASLDYQCDPTGHCDRCGKTFWRGDTLFSLGRDKICPECLETYLKERKEVV